MNNKIDTIVLSGGSVNGFILMGSVQYIYDCYDINEIRKMINMMLRERYMMLNKGSAF